MLVMMIVMMAAVGMFSGHMGMMEMGHTKTHDEKTIEQQASPSHSQPVEAEESSGH